MGASAEQIEAAVAQASAGEDQLVLRSWREGRAARLFVAMETQWRWAGMGARVGLEYAMIETTARLIGVDLEPREELFAHIRVMEAEALNTWAAQAKRK